MTALHGLNSENFRLGVCYLVLDSLPVYNPVDSLDGNSLRRLSRMAFGLCIFGSADSSYQNETRRSEDSFVAKLSQTRTCSRPIRVWCKEKTLHGNCIIKRLQHVCSG